MEKHIQRFRRTKKGHGHGSQPSSTPIILQPPSITTTSAPSIPSLTSLTTTTTSNNRPSTSSASSTTSTPPSAPTHQPPPPPPGTPPPNTLSLPPVSQKPPRKLSPFRGFHLRPSSHKRARDSPPASLPHSPTTATAPPYPEQQQQARPRTAHAGSGGAHLSGSAGADRGLVGMGMGRSLDGTSDAAAQGKERTGRKRMPRMPRFLELSDKDIQEKFNDLVWQERNRLAQSSSNPSPTFRWARVPATHHTRQLDRYMNIQPWQNNRVRLRVPEGMGVDYINASPVVLWPTKRSSSKAGGKDGGKEEGMGQEKDATVGEVEGTKEDGDGEGEVHRYIAMQGPKQNSAAHVWRMVVEQLESPGVIVMLTETHEAGMEKCWQYFPREVGESVAIPEEFGDGFGGTVTCEGLEDTPAGEAIELRRLVVRVRRAGKIGGGTEEKRASTPEDKRSGRSELDVARGSLESGGMEIEGGLEGLGGLEEKMKSPTADIREGMGRLGEFDFGASGSDATTTATATATAATDETATTATATATASTGQEREAEEGEVEERTVYHFLYKKWPDFGVPALEDLDSFFTLMRLSREKNASPSNPRVVHCSAGVGRSGTFIALEHLMRELERGVLEDWDEGREDGDGMVVDGGGGASGENGGGEDSGGSGLDGMGWPDGGDDLIFTTVNALREQRRTMVQADAQYLFIYQVLRKLWLEKYGGAAASGREGSGEPAAKRLEVDPFVG